MKYLSILIFLMMTFVNANEDFPCRISKELDQAAHNFMEQNQLIHEGEESFWESINQGVRWQLMKVNEYKGRCLLSMRLTSTKEPTSSGELEVLGLIEGKVILFEELFQLDPINDVVVAEFRLNNQSMNGEEHIYANHPGYFAKLSGKSAVDVRKAFYSGHTGRNTANDGFIGKVRKGERSEWDPVDRIWGLVNASFALRNSSIGEETSSIYSYQLDLEDFDVYYAGGIKMIMPDGKEALNVRPWDQALIKLIELD